ncbi:MAG: hypothetical protein JNN09_02675 [Alphaproteobacteria bacterium]|nr:hypothetical protein [Alphaproteobacteria bacterium]
MDDDFVLNKHRLSDRIFYALQLALVQGDDLISETLVSALDMAMTRNSGGGEFVERRDYPAEVEAALQRYRALKNQK